MQAEKEAIAVVVINKNKPLLDLTSTPHTIHTHIYTTTTHNLHSDDDNKPFLISEA